MQIGMQKNATDSSAAHRHNAPVNPHSMDKTLKSQVDHKPEYTKEELSLASAILEVERTIKNVVNYRSALQESPEKELASLINAMNGGYVNPSPGGDPIANPIHCPPAGTYLASMLKKHQQNRPGKKVNNWQ
jgi:cobaltochelatase CobN subunit (EC 6.6.1.2)